MPSAESVRYLGQRLSGLGDRIMQMRLQKLKEEKSEEMAPLVALLKQQQAEKNTWAIKNAEKSYNKPVISKAGKPAMSELDPDQTWQRGPALLAKRYQSASVARQVAHEKAKKQSTDPFNPIPYNAGEVDKEFFSARPSDRAFLEYPAKNKKAAEYLGIE
jgi:hypothetical protein